MCRDNATSGRRCPCDTSAARKARRVKAAARAVNTDTLTETLTTFKSASEAVSEAPTPIPVTTESVREQTAAAKQFSTDITEYETLLLTRDKDAAQEARFAELHEKFLEKKTPQFEERFTQWELDMLYEKEIVSLGENIAALSVQNGTYETLEDFQSAIDADPEVAEIAEKVAVETSEEEKASAEMFQKLNELIPGEFREQPEDSPQLPVAVWRIMSYFDPDHEDNKNLSKMTKVYYSETALKEWKERAANVEPPLYTDEGHEEVKALLQTYREKAWKLMHSSSALERLRNEKLNRLLDERGDVYKSTLREVSEREYGGVLEIADNSAKNKNKVLKQALEIYPQSWIEASNQDVEKTGTSLRIKHTDARAHYSSRAYQDEITMQPVTRNWSQPEGWEPEPGSLEAIEYQRMSEEELTKNFWFESDNMWVKHENDYAHMQYPEYSSRKSSVIGYNRDGVLRNNFDKPRGAGWEPVVFSQKVWNPATREDETVEVHSWKRPVKKRVTSGAKIQAELKIDNSQHTGSLKAEGYTTAMHELAHRFEHTSGTKLSRLEKAFLTRRTIDENGTQEQITPIYPDQKVKKGKEEEVGIKDNFVSHYMGKLYNTGRYFEIMSTGVEGVFGGAYGGFIGARNYATDREHRNFVLGVLAVE